MWGLRKAMKVRDENKSKQRKNFDGRKDFVWLYQKSGMTDFDELWTNNSSHTKGTICPVNE